MGAFNPQRLRKARGWARLSQRDLASQLGVTEKTIRRWEKGRNEPTGGALVRLSAILKRHPEFFYPDDDDEEKAA